MFFRKHGNDDPSNVRRVKKKGHSIQVPRLYKESAKLLMEVQKGGSVQNLIYKVNHRNLKAIYALTCNAMRNNTLLDHVLNTCGVLNEKFDVHLAKVLASELLWGKKSLPGDSKPIKLMMGFKSKLEAAVESADVPVALETGLKPRYARVNTTLSTVEGTIKCLEQNEWKLIDTPESYDVFLDHAMNMNNDQFMKDFHFEDLLVFPPKSELHSDELVEKGSLILQDKASCLAPLLLNPTPNSVVLDMCAAPGVKTAHLANLMKNKGTLFAVEKNANRFNSMNQLVSKFCGLHNCVKPILADAVTITPDQCPDVKYILVDPSCTGSGMTKRIEDQNNGTDINRNRIEKLANFQVRILIQALTEFPGVKRIVYCTCSIFKDENEEVIQRVLTRFPEFQVVEPCFKKWERRGDSQYSFGSRCLVSDFDGDLTNGMFIAVLEKISPESGEAMETNDTSEGWQFPKTRMTRKRKSDASLNSVNKTDEKMEEDTPSGPKKKVIAFKKGKSNCKQTGATEKKQI